VLSLLTKEALGFLINEELGLLSEADSFGGLYGGVGAALPPRASFFGVRSLSLVLADFGTLLFRFICSYLSVLAFW
jgi:hypothetical protein